MHVLSAFNYRCKEIRTVDLRGVCNFVLDRGVQDVFSQLYNLIRKAHATYVPHEAALNQIKEYTYSSPKNLTHRIFFPQSWNS